MMTREQIRKFFIELVIVLVLSVLLISMGSIASIRKADNRLQRQYIQEFKDVMPADGYSKINDSIVSNYPEIQECYAAYDKDDVVIGYVIDIIVTNEDSTSLHLLLGISANDTNIKAIKRVYDEANPVKLIPEELEMINGQLVGRQIPVALFAERETLVVADDSVQLISGLTDGTFYAQKQFADRNGYIDYVEIEVVEGVITRVQWNAFNTDPTTPDKREASLLGSYDVVGDSWASQSYNLCHALMNLQDPDKLAMKSDGTTEIVEGVDISIRPFVELAKECITNSKLGYTKDDYYKGLEYVLFNLFELPIDELGLMRDGFIVYSFSDYPNLFKLYDDFGNEARNLNVREYEEYYTTGTITEVKDTTGVVDETPSAPSYSDGSEDGIVIGYDSDELTNNVDGLPKSEIVTYFEGAPMSQPESKNVATAINISYIFLKEYQNWVA